MMCVFNNLLTKMHLEDEHRFQNYIQMARENSLELLAMDKNDITKQISWLRYAIPPEIKLAAAHLNDLLSNEF